MAVTIAAVIFDFYGTLTVGRSPHAQARARAEQARVLGVDASAFHAALDASFRERSRGETGSAEETLARLARQLGSEPDAPALAAAAALRLESERRFGQPRPEALPLLRELRARGLRIGVVSDCSSELPIYFPELALAPVVDAAVFSYLTGNLKPDPANYLACCRRLDVAPSACWYVGDGGSNELHGARALGMHPVHLDVAIERGDVVYGRHAHWDGDTITSLSELVPLIDARTQRSSSWTQSG
jgi:putative hydrolase of the HAD superfamily